MKFGILKIAMPLKLCPVCKRPYLAENEFCPRCPQLQGAEKWTTLGCLLAMTVLPLAIVFIFWFIFFFGFFLQ